MPSVLSRLLGAVTWVVSHIAWLALTAAVSLGAAGLTATLEHRPGTAAREELTWAADQQVAGPLDGIVNDLGTLSADFTDLGIQGRAALSALAATDPVGVGQAIDGGKALVDRIAAETTSLRNRLAELPATGPDQGTRLGPTLLARMSGVSSTLAVTQGIATAWATLTAGAASASQLTTLLTQHDKVAGQGVQLGSQGRYADALVQFDTADAVLRQASDLRDRLGNTADVETLSSWIARNQAIDAALRKLYTTMVASGGVVNAEARTALDEVAAARQALPPDTRGLVVIMAELAQSGMNQAVIRIEQARGRLADAVAQLSASPPPAAQGD